MDLELRNIAFDQVGVKELDTEALLITRIKILAVTMQHTAVQTVSLHKAEQLPDESTKAFAARIRGIASNFNLEKLCSCDRSVSYLEETMYNVVLKELQDQEMREQCTP
jgi:hypothetical protein